MKTNNLTKEDVKKLLGAKTERSLSGQRVTFGKRNELHLQKQYG
mgnify:CR=1 FL=1